MRVVILVALVAIVASLASPCQLPGSIRDADIIVATQGGVIAINGKVVRLYSSIGPGDESISETVLPKTAMPISVRGYSVVMRAPFSLYVWKDELNLTDGGLSLIHERQQPEDGLFEEVGGSGDRPGVFILRHRISGERLELKTPDDGCVSVHTAPQPLEADRALWLLCGYFYSTDRSGAPAWKTRACTGGCAPGLHLAGDSTRVLGVSITGALRVVNIEDGRVVADLLPGEYADISVLDGPPYVVKSVENLSNGWLVHLSDISGSTASSVVRCEEDRCTAESVTASSVGRIRFWGSRENRDTVLLRDGVTTLTSDGNRWKVSTLPTVELTSMRETE